MAIKDLKIKEGNVDIIVEVVSKDEVREFQKFGKPGRVCNAKVKDDSGEVVMTLWNEDIDKVKVGDKIHIKNGWVGEWQGEPQLSTGRFGELEVVGGSESSSTSTKNDPAQEETIDIQEEKIE
jgi:replication factor A1